MRTKNLTLSRAEELLVKLHRIGLSMPPAYTRLESRFDKFLPPQFLTGNPVHRRGSITYLDTYQFGDVHNVNHVSPFSSRLTPSGRRKRKHWNAPMPMPADLSKLIEAIDSSKVLVLGRRSDPFQWLDLKHGITRTLLESISNLRSVPRYLEINTRSDLVAHDDYIPLLKQIREAGCMLIVRIFMPTGSADKTRRLEPGAPSKKRRLEALRKLKSHGINIELIRESV